MDASLKLARRDLHLPQLVRALAAERVGSLFEGLDPALDYRRFRRVLGLANDPPPEVVVEEESAVIKNKGEPLCSAPVKSAMSSIKPLKVTIKGKSYAAGNEVVDGEARFQGAHGSITLIEGKVAKATAKQLLTKAVEGWRQ